MAYGRRGRAPFKRSYGSRPRSYGRRRSTMGGSFMKRAKTRAIANLRTGGLLAIERKFSDFARPATDLASGGAGVTSGSPSDWSPPLASPVIYRNATGFIYSCAPVALNVLSPGDSGSDRDGRQVINDSIHLRGTVDFKNSADFGGLNAATVVNIVLVLDTQTNGGAPAGGAVFVNPGDLTAVSQSTGSGCFVNLQNSKRFRILKHIRRVLSPAAVAGSIASFKCSGGFIWGMDVPLKGMKTNYVTDTALGLNQNATVASIGDNGLFLFAWADVDAAVQLSYNSRLRFRG